MVERRGPLPLGEAVGYTLQVVKALAHAAARDVVHRDIKPSNVLVTAEGRVKLIDMGLARVRQEGQGAADLTASGVTLGTFDYISPEQARDPRHADVRSDIYSLGCTLFFMLSGRPPFPDGTVLQKLLQHQGDRPPDIRQFRRDLPDELRQVLEKMMAKDPRHRHSTPSELASELLVAAEQSGLRPLVPAEHAWLTSPQTSMSFFRRHMPWMMPVASLLCVVLLLDRFWSHRDDLLPARSSEQTNVEIARTSPVEDPPPNAETSETPTEELFPDPFESSPLTVSPDQWDGYTFLDDAAPPPDSNGSAGSSNSTGQIKDDSDAAPAVEQSLPLREDVLGAAGSFWSEQADEPQTAPADAARDKTAVKQPDLLVVCDVPMGESEYTSLGAACAAAADGDVIELRYNGPREERPVKLSNLHVTIRPGMGYQPLIVFRPDEINPVQYPRSMFTLSAGQLTMRDLAIELQAPRDLPADSWTLLETWGGQSVRLERCSLTICNASDQLLTYHPETAFIRARPAPDAGTAVEGGRAATPLASIEMIDSIARGEAAFLRVEELQPVHLLWNNGLLVTTDMLLSAGGGEVAPEPTETLRLELHHVTAVVRGGLCRLTGTPASPHQLAVQFVCTNDIFMTSPGVPLIEQDGAISAARSRSRLVWNGDRNYYQNVDVFWMVRNIDTTVQPETMSYEAWLTYWGRSRENRPSRTPLTWSQYPGSDRPLHAHTVADYTLEYPVFDHGDSILPGCRGERLPVLLIPR